MVDLCNFQASQKTQKRGWVLVHVSPCSLLLRQSLDLCATGSSFQVRTCKKVESRGIGNFWRPFALGNETPLLQQDV